ncbi:hypothetical protein Nhal_1936 [Nitrosococcus halophilus Nc 4]|uniref:Uncharacterized protein n=1 Tax=Nitrosococcus halophilus (strain Nc4) TaxID=472759 RepID=D5C3S2_NITHN|nr:hypothetical protein [Nitrosococcus halophilus]ADE15044.1 hypothetical protein Nhal_1936 [Nitrosococcus halophilus Nc 4]
MSLYQYARVACISLIGLTLITSTASADDNDNKKKGGKDFGSKVEHLLHAQSRKLFGFAGPLKESAEGNVDRLVDPESLPGSGNPFNATDVDDLIELAHGLRAEILIPIRTDPACYNEEV